MTDVWAERRAFVDTNVLFYSIDVDVTVENRTPVDSSTTDAHRRRFPWWQIHTS